MKMIQIGRAKVRTSTFNKFLKELREGTHEKGTGGLQTKANAFCCLGLSCTLFVRKPTLYIGIGGVIAGGFPDDQKTAPQWLKELDLDMHSKVGIKASKLNDDACLDLSHPEIADVLQAVYIEGVRAV